MEIRTFNSADEPAIIALWKQIFGYPTRHNDPAFSIQRKREVQPEHFWVAIEEGALVGTVMAGYDGHRGWIYSLAVAPDFRNRGIARLLVKTAEDALRKLNCPKINLQVLPKNGNVVAFYKTLGYAVEERISMGKVL